MSISAFDENFECIFQLFCLLCASTLVPFKWKQKKVHAKVTVCRIRAQPISCARMERLNDIDSRIHKKFKGTMGGEVEVFTTEHANFQVKFS